MNKIISIGVVEIIRREFITVVAVNPKYTSVLKRVGPVKIIKKIIPGCFFRRGNSLTAFWRQKGVRIRKAITQR